MCIVYIVFYICTSMSHFIVFSNFDLKAMALLIYQSHMIAILGLLLGCPWNNQSFFWVRTETNQNSICFGCFLVCLWNQKTFFRFVSVFRTSIETTKTNRTLPKQTETNRKNLQKSFLLGGPKNSFFFSRFEPKQTETQSVSVVFGLFQCFRPISKQPK